MASPKITKQGASFPEDEPGTPKLLPGDGGDRDARIQRAEAAARPGEQGERFAKFNQRTPVEGRHAEQGDTEDEQTGEQETGEQEEPETYESWTKDALQGEAAKRNLATSGTKEALAARLREHDKATADDSS